MTPSFQTSLQPLLKEFQQLNFSEEPNQQSKQLQSTIVNNFSTFLVFHKKFISWVQMALKEESKQRDCVKSIQQVCPLNPSCSFLISPFRSMTVFMTFIWSFKRIVKSLYQYYKH